MRETEISSLEKQKTPAGAMFERLTCLAPNLTVYYLCKTLRVWSQADGCCRSSFKAHGDIRIIIVVADLFPVVTEGVNQ